MLIFTKRRRKNLRNKTKKPKHIALKEKIPSTKKKRDKSKRRIAKEKYVKKENKAVSHENSDYLKIKRDPPLIVAFDPGLASPGLCIMSLYDGKVLKAIRIKDPKIKFKTSCVFRRSFLIAEEVALALEEVDLPEYGNSPLIIAIEASTFSKHSQSLEALAHSRQAVYSRLFFSNGDRIMEWWIVPVADVKRITGKGVASKLEVCYAVLEKYPEVLEGIKIEHNIKKGKKAGTIEATQEASAIADAVAVADHVRRSF